jgi:hypothetical protein
LSEAKYFPRRLSFPKLCDILIGYLNAGADNTFVGASDVVERSNVTLHNISRNNNFFKSWNFVEESEQEPGKYLLSREAAEFAYAYRIDPNGERTRQMLNKFLSRDEVLTQFVERVRRENLSRDAVLVELPRVIGDLRADKVGLTAFVDMISYAFQLEETTAPVKATRQPREPRRTIRPIKKPELAAAEAAISSFGPNISINLTITPDVSPEKLKAYIKAVLEAYDEHGEEEE